jgi:hypothetical protein
VETGSVKSGKSSKSTTSGISAFSKRKTRSPSTAPTSPQQLTDEDNVAAQVSNLSLTHNSTTPQTSSSAVAVRIIYLTEQVSHPHLYRRTLLPAPQGRSRCRGSTRYRPRCRGRRSVWRPGSSTRGFSCICLAALGQARDHLTHPVALVNGILRGSFYAMISESTIITCEGGKPWHKFRTIVEYKEEVCLVFVFFS